MKSLAEIQDQMQRAMLGRANHATALVAQPPAGDAGSRLSVYTRGYVLRLTEFLTNDYPKLHAYVGDVRFGRIAESYIRAHPSDNPNARWFSRNLPEHLARDKAYRRNPEVGEMALLERALNDAFDGPEAPVCTMADLAQFEPETFGDICFTLAPSMSKLSVTTNVTSLWSSLKCGETPPSPEDMDEPADILVWRQGGASRFRILGREESMALACAKDGMSFGHLCEMMAAYDDPDGAGPRAAGYLRGWIEAEIISCMRLTPDGAK